MTTMTDQQFQQLLTALTEALKGQQMAKSTSKEMEPDRSFDVLAGRIAEFSYDTDADLTFEAWYQRHQDIFTVNAQKLDEPTRVLLHKLDATAYGKYSNYILPKTQRDVTFEEAISTLMGLFGPQQSLFSRRYACMKLTKDPNDDFVTYAGRINRECAKFRLAECDENQFKCLIFVSGLQSSDHAFIRLKLLDKIEADPTCSVQSLTEECKRLTNLKRRALIS
nr:Unknown [Haemonchus contortus]